MATPTVNIRKSSSSTASPVGRVASKVGYVWATARISLASVFLWAFFDKTFGLGYSTPVERAWINGGSPTTGFLSNTDGWFGGFFQTIAGSAAVDWLFMVGLLGIGLALLLGIGMRVAAASGATLMVLMYLASMPGTTNPFMDDHVVYALVLVGLAMAKAGNTLGLGGYWSDLAAVRRYPILE
jgi:thiosulfate dehydrogenase (quinone) large subunit